LAKKCIPRPRPKAVGGSSRKPPKDKGQVEAPNTTMQEVPQTKTQREAQAKAREEYITNTLAFSRTDALLRQSRKTGAAAKKALKKAAKVHLSTPEASDEEGIEEVQEEAHEEPPPPPPEELAPAADKQPKVRRLEPLAMETTRVGTRQVITHSSAATAEQPRAVEAAPITIREPAPEAAPPPQAQPRAPPLPPSFHDQALYEMYMWLRGNHPAWDERKVMSTANEMLGRVVSRRGKQSDSDSHSEVEEVDSPFARIKGYKGSSAAKVTLPNPPKFDGDLNLLIPAHYPDPDAYLEHLAKTAIRGRLPFGEIVQTHFTKTAGIWAQQFFKGGLGDDTGLTTEQLNNAKYNAVVYNTFHASFMKHFAVQLRTRQQAALDTLFRSKTYKMQVGESVPLYLARFQALCKEAGGVTDEQAGYLFREGLNQSLKDRTLSDKRKRFVTLAEIYEACLVQEDVDAHKTKTTPTPNTLSYANTKYTRPQGQQQQGQRWKGGEGGGRGRGREGFKKWPSKRQRRDFREGKAGSSADQAAEGTSGKEHKRFKGKFRKPFKKHAQHKRVRFNAISEHEHETHSDEEEYPNPPQLNVTRTPAGRRAPAGYAFVQGKDELVKLPD